MSRGPNTTWNERKKHLRCITVINHPWGCTDTSPTPQKTSSSMPIIVGTLTPAIYSPVLAHPSGRNTGPVTTRAERGRSVLIARCPLLVARACCDVGRVQIDEASTQPKHPHSAGWRPLGKQTGWTRLLAPGRAQPLLTPKGWALRIDSHRVSRKAPLNDEAKNVCLLFWEEGHQKGTDEYDPVFNGTQCGNKNSKK